MTRRVRGRCGVASAEQAAGGVGHHHRASGNGVALVAKGPDAADAEAAIAEVTDLIKGLGKTPIPGEPPDL